MGENESSSYQLHTPAVSGCLEKLVLVLEKKKHKNMSKVGENILFVCLSKLGFQLMMH